MKVNQVLQSVFIALILVGLFAMMAQNGYGYTLMGTACFGLALLYVAQVSWKLFEDFSSLEKKDIFGFAELFLLASLLLLFGMRAFYIRPPYIDLIFIVTCGLLVAVYFLIASGIFTAAKKENPELARNVFFFYSSILLFLLSLGTRIVNQSWSSVIGGLGFLASVPFLIALVRKRQFEYSGKTISIVQLITGSKNKAGLLFLFFASSALYTALAYTKIIPTIENSAKPKDYIELINNAETGKEKPVDGKYQHEKYKEAMDKFLEKHGKK